MTDESNKEETTADDDSNNLSTSTTPIVRRFSENHVRGLGQTDAEDEVDEAGFVQDHTDEGDPNYSSSRESAESQELERQEKYYLKGMSKLKELLSTEATYVESSLCQVVDGYYRYLNCTRVLFAKRCCAFPHENVHTSSCIHVRHRTNIRMLSCCKLQVFI